MEPANVGNVVNGRSQGDGMEMRPEIGSKDPEEGLNSQGQLMNIKGISASTLYKDVTTVSRTKGQKFVPFEPYKAAVKSIVPGHPVPQYRVGVTQLPSGPLAGAQTKLNEDMRPMESPVKCDQKEIAALEAQLKIQIQVNKELKKLLVASIGEDMQTRVQFLTEDKARLAHDIVKYSHKLVQESEQLEKLSIQCDVWRSKFLASSMMVDELVNWKACLCHELQEAKTTLKMLLNEQCHNVANPLANSYRNLKSLRDAFDPLAAQRDSRREVSRMDGTRLAVEVEKLSKALHFRLLSSESRCTFDGVSLTRGQLFAQQIIERPHLYRTLTDSPAGGKPNFSRFHPSTRYEHLTFYCCNHCKGEIKVV